VNPLSSIARDLVERRLWPVAALLAALLVAVPVLFLRPSPAALDGTTPTPAPAAAATTGPTGVAGVAGVAATPTTDVGADPSVGLTSSPFAAAFGAGLSLPPSMEGLLKATKGADHRKDVADAPLHDPFAVEPAAAASSTPAAPRATQAAAPSGGSSPAPAEPTPAPVSVSSAPPVTPTPPVPVPSVPATPVDDGSAPAVTKTVYHADVRFGTTEQPPLVSDAKRLTAFPSSFEPVAVYLGVLRGGWGAAFALRDGTQPVGNAACRPRKQICTWVILHPGETVTLSVKDETTGAVTPYQLKLDRIRKTTVSPDAAKLANGRVSVAGRCLLGPLAAYRYDTASGTLAPRPELKACKYRTPGQAETASVRVAHVG
jgi:hypothetical protein